MKLWVVVDAALGDIAFGELDFDDFLEVDLDGFEEEDGGKGVAIGGSKLRIETSSMSATVAGAVSVTVSVAVAVSAAFAIDASSGVWTAPRANDANASAAAFLDDARAAFTAASTASFAMIAGSSSVLGSAPSFAGSAK